MKRLAVIFVVMVLLAGTLAGCSGSADSTSNGASDSNGSSSASAASAASATQSSAGSEVAANTCKITKIAIDPQTSSLKVTSIQAESGGETHELYKSNLSGLFSDMTFVSMTLPANSAMSADAFGNFVLQEDFYLLLEAKQGSDTYEIKLGPGMEYLSVLSGDSLQIKYDPSYCTRKS